MNQCSQPTISVVVDSDGVRYLLAVPQAVMATVISCESGDRQGRPGLRRGDAQHSYGVQKGRSHLHVRVPSVSLSFPAPTRGPRVRQTSEICRTRRMPALGPLGGLHVVNRRGGLDATVGHRTVVGVSNACHR